MLFYEVDKDNERYATRMAEVFVTEAPVPTVSEINADPDYYAEIITKEEFDTVYNSNSYEASIVFPR